MPFTRPSRSSTARLGRNARVQATRRHDSGSHAVALNPAMRDEVCGTPWGCAQQLRLPLLVACRMVL